MLSPQPKTIAEGLISKLNLIRLLQTGEERDRAIAEVSFSAQRLRNADPSGHLGVQGMIAALRLDLDGIRAVEDQLRAHHVDDLQEHHNTIRSYAVVGAWDEAIRLMDEGMPRFEGVDFHLHWVTYMLVLCTDLERARRIGALAARRPVPSAFSYTLEAQEVLVRLDKLNVSSAELRQALNTAHLALTAEGWPTSAIGIIAPTFGHEDDYPAAFIDIDVDGDPERVLEVEDSVLAMLGKSGGAAFADGRLSCFVASTSETENADLAA